MKVMEKKQKKFRISIVDTDIESDTADVLIGLHAF